MLICILTKNVITSCSVTMMLFLHLEVKPLMTLTTVLYLRSEERFSRNAETDLVCRLLLEKKKKNKVTKTFLLVITLIIVIYNRAALNLHSKVYNNRTCKCT